jgi:hypothetical protein
MAVHPNLGNVGTDLWYRLANTGFLPMRPFPLVAQEVNSIMMMRRGRIEIAMTEEFPTVPFIVAMRENGFATLEVVDSGTVDDNYMMTMAVLKGIVDFHNSMV